MKEIYNIAPSWENLVESKLAHFSDINLDLSSYTVTLHNASWCPDCERETTDLLALINALNEKAPKLTVIHYEDKEEYKEKKKQNKLEVSCLPTIVFKDSKGNEVLKIEEDSSGKLKDLVLEFNS